MSIDPFYNPTPSQPPRDKTSQSLQVHSEGTSDNNALGFVYMNGLIIQ